MNAEKVEQAWLAVSDFAGKHAASLATAAEDPRDPSFSDDWCALVTAVAGAYAAIDGHEPALLPQGWPKRPPSSLSSEESQS